MDMEKRFQQAYDDQFEMWPDKRRLTLPLLNGCVRLLLLFCLLRALYRK
jgi:hypothetical protein